MTDNKKAAPVGQLVTAQYQNSPGHFNNIESKLSLFLNRLDGVKTNGSNRWLAKCPAHPDRSPSLAIRLADDRILIHCFAGCSVDAVLSAVGLDMADLFPDRVAIPGAPKPKAPRFSAYELFPLLIQEALILALAFHAVTSGDVLADTDMQRAEQAYNAVLRLNSEVKP
ncbi:hypothetical protein A1507_15555 [Methylomonas koyamae]|uniref:Zinc finger CHC2-type domain-containing protein n=1 Tax=Methylomonas koyamae TaxID=702114 RepID=A0A177N8F7_9GAMM|nr:hypothetical protein [Methylomonas koyamae]OAI14217.1 hypothetical protein A1507_15555 [Methylomonas koyamae]